MERMDGVSHYITTEDPGEDAGPDGTIFVEHLAVGLVRLEAKHSQGKFLLDNVPLQTPERN